MARGQARPKIPGMPPKSSGGDGVFPILEELFSRAVDLQTASAEDVSILSPISEYKLTSIISESGLGASQDHPPYDPLCHGLIGN